jgi:uncharacterized OB-fold protein
VTPAPAPTPDLESERFWQGVREHRVLLQRCPACSKVRFPPMPACPYCGASGHGEEVQVAGSGLVYSWVRAHIALTPAMQDQVPYTVATIELDDGPRLVGAVGDHGEVAIGDRVIPVFTDHGDWTELRFKVTR